MWAAHRCSRATRLQRPIQFCRHQHTFGLVEELDEDAHTSPCYIQCTRQWEHGRARSSIRQTRCCGSADGNGITSQTIQTEKAPNVYCWWNAMKFRRLPRGGILQRCATEQQSSVKSHCCLCVRHSESIASLLNRIRPLIFLYIYAFIAIFITLQYRLARTIFLCNLLCWLSAVQFTWVWLYIYYFTHHFSRKVVQFLLLQFHSCFLLVYCGIFFCHLYLCWDFFFMWLNFSWTKSFCNGLPWCVFW